ncbi:MAG: RbsD/FucU family protein [Victivallales bacterium]
MIRGRLIHPQILEALASSGHFSRVLIADGNFPTATVSNPAAKVVFLNFAPGMLRTTDILEVLLEVMPVQDAAVMLPPEPQKLHEEYKRMLRKDIRFQMLKREEFYDAIRSHQTSLVIASGDKRRFANILLTIGVLRFEK